MKPNPELEDLLTHRELIGKSGKVISAGGISTRNNLHILEKLCEALRPQRTLEIGLGPGGSAFVFAAYHQAHNHPPASHSAIDPFQKRFFDDIAIAALTRAELIEYVRLLRRRSDLELPALASQGEQFQLIYNDGSHLFEDTFVDLYYCHQLLPVGGVLVFDDCSDPHVLKVLRFIFTNWQSFYEEVDLLPYRPPTNPIKYAIAKRLNRVQCRAFRKIKDGFRFWTDANNPHVKLARF